MSENSSIPHQIQLDYHTIPNIREIVVKCIAEYKSRSHTHLNQEESDRDNYSNSLTDPISISEMSTLVKRKLEELRRSTQPNYKEEDLIRDSVMDDDQTSNSIHNEVQANHSSISTQKISIKDSSKNSKCFGLSLDYQNMLVEIVKNNNRYRNHFDLYQSMGLISRLLKE